MADTSTGRQRIALVWFPPGELAEALERWPGYAEHWDGPNDDRTYARALEGHLRQFHDQGLTVSVAPVAVEGLVGWAEQRDEDPGDRQTRAQYAAELQRRDEVVAWPPARNERCWCRSGEKYKRCCSTVEL